MTDILLGDEPLTLDRLSAIARSGANVGLGVDSINTIVAARTLVDSWIREGKIIYGITTGFGALSDQIISSQDTSQLQRNILMSHAAGVGQPLDHETVRAVIALRVNDMARGNSGIGLE